MRINPTQQNSKQQVGFGTTFELPTKVFMRYYDNMVRAYKEPVPTQKLMAIHDTVSKALHPLGGNDHVSVSNIRHETWGDDFVSISYHAKKGKEPVLTNEVHYSIHWDNAHEGFTKTCKEFVEHCRKGLKVQSQITGEK